MSSWLAASNDAPKRVRFSGSLRIWQDVEPGAMPCGDREDAVELAPCSSQGKALAVAIDLQRVDAADQIGAAVLKRLSDYVVAHLDEPIEVAALAKIAAP